MRPIRCCRKAHTKLHPFALTSAWYQTAADAQSSWRAGLLCLYHAGISRHAGCRHRAVTCDILRRRLHFEKDQLIHPSFQCCAWNIPAMTGGPHNASPQCCAQTATHSCQGSVKGLGNAARVVGSRSEVMTESQWPMCRVSQELPPLNQSWWTHRWG